MLLSAIAMGLATAGLADAGASSRPAGDRRATPAGGTAVSARPATAPSPAAPAAPLATVSVALAAPEFVRVRQASPRSLRVSWHAVTGATSYRVWRAAKPSSRRQLVAQTRSTVLQWVDRGLTAKAVQRYQVQPCTAAGCGPRSRPVSAAPFPPGSPLSNAASVTYAGFRPEPFGVLEQYRLKMKVRTGRTHAAGRRDRVWNRRLRYLTADPSIATVSRRGVVSAWREGHTTLRVIAHNGAEKQVPINVQSYATPATFNTAAGGDFTGNLADYWDAQGPRLSTFVAMALHQRISGRVEFSLDPTDGHLVVTGQATQPVADLAQTILTDYWLPGSIVIADRSIDFELYNEGPEPLTTLSYLYDYDATIQGLGPRWPAPHWYFTGSYIHTP